MHGIFRDVKYQSHMNYKQIIHSFFILFVVFAVCLVLGGKKTEPAVAGHEHTVRGYAWASNLGWISFNSLGDGKSPSYGVTTDGSGVLSGAAWGDNIGWIKFDPSFAGPAGGGDNYSARIIGDTMSGWARACTAFINSDCNGALRDTEWDGWIKFTHASIDAGKFVDGAAWGGFSVPATSRTAFLTGWIDLSGLCVVGINCPGLTSGGADASVVLKGKIRLSSNEPTVEAISITSAQDAAGGIQIYWESAGSIDECDAVRYKRTGGSYSNLGIDSGDEFGGTGDLTNLSDGQYIFEYQCLSSATGNYTKAKDLIVNVNVNGSSNSCSGAPYGNEVLTDTTREIIYRSCAGDGGGPGSWHQTSSCSSARCEYTRTVQCRRGYVDVNGTCRLSEAEYEEF